MAGPRRVPLYVWPPRLGWAALQGSPMPRPPSARLVRQQMTGGQVEGVLSMVPAEVGQVIEGPIVAEEQ